MAQIAFVSEKDGDVPDDLVKLDDGYAVMQLKEKSAASREQFENERETFVAAMLAAKQADALNGLRAAPSRSGEGPKPSSTRLTERLPRKKSRREGDEE
mgnify:CR=1 FL=1